MYLSPCNISIPPKKVSRLFKFKSIWSTNSECRDAVQSKWQAIQASSLIFKPSQNLKRCQSSLKHGVEMTFGNNKIKFANIKSQFTDIQLQPPMESNLQTQEMLKSEMKTLMKRQEMFFHEC